MRLISTSGKASGNGVLFGFVAHVPFSSTFDGWHLQASSNNEAVAAASGGSGCSAAPKRTRRVTSPAAAASPRSSHERTCSNHWRSRSESLSGDGAGAAADDELEEAAFARDARRKSRRVGDAVVVRPCLASAMRGGR